MSNPTTVALKRHLKRAAIQTGLEAFSIASDLGLLPQEGLGAIFTLHRVEPQQSSEFDPSAQLSITPDYLEAVIKNLLQQGYEPIALSDIPARINNSAANKRFMAFTLDDGYRNNIEYALPVFKKHNIPFTLFACAGFISREHTIWWETARELIAKTDHFKIDLGMGERHFETRTLSEKYAAFDQVARDMMQVHQTKAVQTLDRIAVENSIDPRAITDHLFAGEAELKTLSQEPLADIGAHTISHPNLTKLDQSELVREMEQSIAYIENVTGNKPPHFAFPYGKKENAGPREFKTAKDLGFHLAVTTEPDVIKKENVQNLHALKRISLNGYYQKIDYLDALASGAAFKYRLSA